MSAKGSEPRCCVNGVTSPAYISVLTPSGTTSAAAAAADDDDDDDDVSWCCRFSSHLLVKNVKRRSGNHSQPSLFHCVFIRRPF